MSSIPDTCLDSRLTLSHLTGLYVLSPESHLALARSGISFSAFGGLKIFMSLFIDTSELCQLCQEKSDNDNDRNKIDGQKVVSGHQRLV